MYKQLVLAVAMILTTAMPALAQAGARASGSSAGQIVGGIAMLLAALWMLGHMLYILFFRRKFRTDYTVEDMRQKRIELGAAPDSTDDEDQAAYDVMQVALDEWLVFNDPQDGEETALPLERSVVKQSAAALEQAISYCPTHPEVIDRINNMADVVNAMRNRTFTASKTMLVLLWIMVVILGLSTKNWGTALTFGAVWSAVYGMASMKPDYVLIRKELEGKEESSFLSGIIGGLFGAVAAAPVYRTVTTYSDGSKETSDDHSASLFTLIFAIIAAVFMVIIMPIFAAVNYLRNYVFA